MCIHIYLYIYISLSLSIYIYIYIYTYYIYIYIYITLESLFPFLESGVRLWAMALGAAAAAGVARKLRKALPLDN